MFQGSAARDAFTTLDSLPTALCTPSQQCGREFGCEWQSPPNWAERRTLLNESVRHKVMRECEVGMEETCFLVLTTQLRRGYVRRLERGVEIYRGYPYDGDVRGRGFEVQLLSVILHDISNTMDP